LARPKGGIASSAILKNPNQLRIKLAKMALPTQINETFAGYSFGF